MRRFVALDVEIASRSPIRICALGLAQYEDGQELGVYRSSYESMDLSISDACTA